MTGLVFVDTKLLVRARDPRDPVTQTVARDWLHTLWTQQRGRTSVQVLSEYFEFVTRHLGSVSPEDAWDDVHFYLAWNPQPLDVEVLSCAHEIEHRHRLPWWDCLTVAAAQVQNCVLLLSDELQDGADYGGVIVRSPFTLRIAEEAGAYTVPARLPSRHRGRGRPRRSTARTASAG